MNFELTDRCKDYRERLLDFMDECVDPAEPDVASSDATNIQLRIERDGDGYVLNGRKWWISNALHPNCKVLIVIGKDRRVGRAPPPSVDARGAARHAGDHARAQPAGAGLLRSRGPRRDPLRGRARPRARRELRRWAPETAGVP